MKTLNVTNENIFTKVVNFVKNNWIPILMIGGTVVATYFMVMYNNNPNF